MKWFLFYSMFILCLVNTSLAQQIVKDVNDVIADIDTYTSARISKMTNRGEKTYFVANDASSGNKTWVIDGTAESTYFITSTNRDFKVVQLVKQWLQ